MSLRSAPSAAVFGALLLLAGAPAAAQTNLIGYWNPLFHEDVDERIPGPSIGDYLGLPITRRRAAARRSLGRLAAVDARASMQAASVDVRFSRRRRARIWEDRDEDTQQLVKIHTHIAWQEQHREIWMDGRPHPPEYAQHTWQGFSTGSFEGDVLVVKTTHLKAGWMRRNGLPLSDRATMTDRFHRYGDLMTHVMIVEDPVYLTEPLVKTNGFLLQPAGTMTPYPCDPVDRDRPRSGLRAALLARTESVHRRVRRGARPAARSDARRRRDGAAGVRGDAAMTAARTALALALVASTLLAVRVQPRSLLPQRRRRRRSRAKRRRSISRANGSRSSTRTGAGAWSRRRRATTRACR